MSIRVMTRVWDHSKSRNGERLVLLAIADFADDHGRAFPSIATLKAKSAMSERGVQQAIARLQESGELRVEIAAGPHGVNVYWVVLSALAEEYTPPQNLPPADSAPPQNLHLPPADSAPKPSENHSLCEREEIAKTVLATDGDAEAPVQTPAKPKVQSPKPKADPMEHLQRPSSWPPALGLGDLDEPVAELYQAYRAARFPAKASAPLLPGEIRKDLPTLQEMHAAGITPAKVSEATQRALLAWSSRDRVTLAAVASHWSSLMDDTPPAPQLRPMPQGGKRRRITPDEAKAAVRRGLTAVLTEGDGF